MEAAGTSICLVMKAALLSGRWAGRTRQVGLEQAASASGDSGELLAGNVTLRDRVSPSTNDGTLLRDLRTPRMVAAGEHLLQHHTAVRGLETLLLMPIQTVSATLDNDLRSHSRSTPARGPISVSLRLSQADVTPTGWSGFRGE